MSSLLSRLKITQSRTIISYLFCIGVILVWFSPWWIGGKNLAPLDLLNEMMSPWRQGNETSFAKNHIVSDAVDQYLVYRIVAAESYAKEGWLGWSSLTYGGTAQYANTMALYYDWTMQLHRWFDFWTAWHLGIMGQVMLAATGMFLFLRGRSIGPLWACCGALAYAANSQFVVWIYHRWALSAFCWVPWIFWTIDCYRRGNRSCWALVPIFSALAFLGGTLQHAAYVVLAVMAIWAEETVEGWRKVSMRESKALTFQRIKLHLNTQSIILGRYAAWGLLATGLSAMMLFPCIDAFLTSTKLGLHMGMHGTEAMGLYPKGLLQPLLNLAAYPLQIFPSAVGHCGTVDLLKLFRSEFFYVAYFGSLPVIIAFITLLRGKSPLLARILIGTGLFLPLTPLLRHLYQRLYLLFILGGILAFSHFMESASVATKKRVFKITSVISGMAILMWTALSIVMKIKQEKLQDLLQQKIVHESDGGSFGYFRLWIQGRADKFLNDLFVWSPHQLIPLCLFVGGLVGLRMCASKAQDMRTRGTVLVMLAVVLEVSVFGARWVTFVDPDRFALFPITQEVTALKDNVGRGRVITLIEETGSHMAVTPFVSNTLSPYNIATIRGYDSIMPNGMLLINQETQDPAKLARLGVTHLITYPRNKSVTNRWQTIWKSPSMELFKNPISMPRYVGFTSTTDKDSFFDGLNPNQCIPLTEQTQKENSRIIEIPKNLKWIRIAENYADGWEYRTNGESRSIWRAVLRAEDRSMLLNLESLSLIFPTIVEMRYNPPLRRTGFTISAASVIFLSFGQWLTFRLRRREL